MRSCSDTKRPLRRHSGRVNQPQQQLHQRWRRGCHPERKTGSRVWEGLARTRERTHQRVRTGRIPCMESSSCHLGQARQHKRPGWMPFGCKYNIADVLGPEEEPPDAQSIEEDSRSPAETERCLEPRTAKSRKRARRSRGSVF